MASEERYRLWLAGETQWQPGPSFPHLALAIDKARRIAVTRWVAIELPTREWHIFDESKTTRLGPPQFARGSNHDLNATASSASRPQPPRTSTAEARRPARVDGTDSGVGPQRTPESTSPPVARQRAWPRPTPSTARLADERRNSERFAAVEVLANPACTIDGQQVAIADVSETGLQLAVPGRLRLRVGSTIVCAFSDRHGRFDLIVKVVWVHSGHAGVVIEDGGANLVGKMFLRKLIAQLLARREAETRRKRRTSRMR